MPEACCSGLDHSSVFLQLLADRCSSRRNLSLVLGIHSWSAVVALTEQMGSNFLGKYVSKDHLESNVGSTHVSIAPGRMKMEPASALVGLQTLVFRCYSARSRPRGS